MTPVWNTQPHRHPLTHRKGAPRVHPLNYSGPETAEFPGSQTVVSSRYPLPISRRRALLGLGARFREDRGRSTHRRGWLLVFYGNGVAAAWNGRSTEPNSPFEDGDCGVASCVVRSILQVLPERLRVDRCQQQRLLRRVGAQRGSLTAPQPFSRVETKSRKRSRRCLRSMPRFRGSAL